MNNTIYYLHCLLLFTVVVVFVVIIITFHLLFLPTFFRCLSTQLNFNLCYILIHLSRYKFFDFHNFWENIESRIQLLFSNPATPHLITRLCFNDLFAKWEILPDCYFGYTTHVQGLCQTASDYFNVTFEPFVIFIITPDPQKFTPNPTILLFLSIAGGGGSGFWFLLLFFL